MTTPVSHDDPRDGSDAPDGPDVVHRFPLDGPISLSARLGHGAVTVRATDDATGDATVELTAGAGGTDLAERVSVGLHGSTLSVHAPRQGGLADLVSPWRPNWSGGVSAVITVPAGTPVKISTFTGVITITGRCGTADLATASGDIRVDEVDGDVTLRYGASQSWVGHVTGSAKVRSGAGDARFGRVDGTVQAGCGSGLLEIGEAGGAVRSRSGSGDARLGAVHGDVDLASGSGELSIGLPAGVTARLDVTTGSGRVRSDLPITDAPATRTGSITVRARTGSGDVRVFRAA